MSFKNPVPDIQLKSPTESLLAGIVQALGQVVNELAEIRKQLEKVTTSRQ